jgi:hypothetical protein
MYRPGIDQHYDLTLFQKSEIKAILDLVPKLHARPRAVVIRGEAE